MSTPFYAPPGFTGAKWGKEEPVPPLKLAPTVEMEKPPAPAAFVPPAIVPTQESMEQVALPEVLETPAVGHAEPGAPAPAAPGPERKRARRNSVFKPAISQAMEVRIISANPDQQSVRRMVLTAMKSCNVTLEQADGILMVPVGSAKAWMLEGLGLSDDIGWRLFDALADLASAGAIDSNGKLDFVKTVNAFINLRAQIKT